MPRPLSGRVEEGSHSAPPLLPVLAGRASLFVGTCCRVTRGARSTSSAAQSLHTYVVEEPTCALSLPITCPWASMPEGPRPPRRALPEVREAQCARDAPPRPRRCIRPRDHTRLLGLVSVMTGPCHSLRRAPRQARLPPSPFAPLRVCCMLHRSCLARASSTCTTP